MTAPALTMADPTPGQPQAQRSLSPRPRSCPIQLSKELTLMDASLPRRIFAQDAGKDVSRLAQIARVLLCLDPQTLRTSLESIPRFQQAVHGLLRLKQWPDLLERNPILLVQVLPLLRLYRRCNGSDLHGAFAPLERLLREGIVKQGEWMPLFLLDITVGLQELGCATPDSVQEARAQTLLDVEVPGWVWCFEKSSVLDFLMVVTGAAQWGLPVSWRRTCTAGLAHALRGGDHLAVGRAAFHHRLGGGSRELLRLAWTVTPPKSSNPWDQALGHAYWAASYEEISADPGSEFTSAASSQSAPTQQSRKESAMFTPFDWNALHTWTATALQQPGNPQDHALLNGLAQLCSEACDPDHAQVSVQDAPGQRDGTSAASLPSIDWLLLPDDALREQVRLALGTSLQTPDPVDAWVLPACAMAACREYQLDLAADLLRLMIQRHNAAPAVTEIAEFLAFQQRPSGECGYVNPLQPAPFAAADMTSRFTLPVTSAIAHALRMYEQVYGREGQKGAGDVAAD